MSFQQLARMAIAAGLALTLSACGNGLFSDNSSEAGDEFARQQAADVQPDSVNALDESGEGSSVWDLFSDADDPNTTVEVNKYIWQASLEVLNFLPVESVDPFTGVLVTGFGRPPGGGRAYRATVYVQDPALDARSLKVALQSQGGGAVAPETVRAVEDAILTRARQLRIRDANL